MNVFYTLNKRVAGRADDGSVRIGPIVADYYAMMILPRTASLIGHHGQADRSYHVDYRIILTYFSRRRLLRPPQFNKVN